MILQSSHIHDFFFCAATFETTESENSVMKFLQGLFFSPQRKIRLTNSHQLYKDNSHGLWRVKCSQTQGPGVWRGMYILLNWTQMPNSTRQRWWSRKSVTSNTVCVLKLKFFMLFKFKEFFRTAPDETDSKSEECRSPGRPQIGWNSRWEVKAVWPSFYLPYRQTDSALIHEMSGADPDTRQLDTYVLSMMKPLQAWKNISTTIYTHTQHAASCLIQEVKKLWPHFRVFLWVHAGQGSV